MKIELKNLGKRYRYEWILKNMNFQFQSGDSYAVLGHNGSGKSTFMQILSGYLSPSAGKIIYTLDNKVIDINVIYRYITFASPYTELIDELTLKESIAFHTKFKPLLNDLKKSDVLELMKFPRNAHDKAVQFFSSGMKQRLKLAQAFFSATPVLLLDEPCTNLDKEGIALYHSLLDNYSKDRIVIISSNDPVEYAHCKSVIAIDDFKKW